MKDNNDTVSRQITSTGAKLKEVERALDGLNRATTQNSKEAFPWVKIFRTYVNFRLNQFEPSIISRLRALANEWQELQSLGNESNIRKILDHEDEQARIKEIFVRINEARVQFEVRTLAFDSSTLYQYPSIARTESKGLQGGV